jgi:alkylated DNA repair dioxygenase AlkB
MESLFPVDPVLPDGFEYFPEYLTPDEEAMLIQAIAQHELHAFMFQGYEAKRKVASFGYDYNFTNRSLTKGKDIPEIFQPLLNRIARQLSIESKYFSELLLTEYPPGAVINWHRDAFPFEVIAGISLLSDCKFRLRPHDKSKQTRRSIISIPVRRRSLYIIQGAARSEWEHSIAPVSTTRYSITLRTLYRKEHSF